MGPDLFFTIETLIRGVCHNTSTANICERVNLILTVI